MKIVKSLQIAIIFKRDQDIQYTLGSMLAKSSKNGLFRISEFPNPNPQKNLPHIPKISVNSKEFVLNISQERFDFFLTIPNHISNEPEKVLSYAKSATDILRNSFLPHVNYLWCGLVIDLNFPYKGNKSCLNDIFDKTLTIERENKNIATYQLNYGYKENGHFINYSISEYQSYEVVKKVPSNELISIKDGNLVEMGLSIKLDINNKPTTPNNSFSEDLDEIYKFIIPEINKVLNNNNLEGIQ